MSNVLLSSTNNERVSRTGVAHGLQSAGKDRFRYPVEYHYGWYSSSPSVDVGLRDYTKRHDIHGIGTVPSVFCEFWTSTPAYPENTQVAQEADSPTNHADQEVRSGN